MDKFKQLVTDGKLPGKLVDDDVVLDKLKPANMELFTSEKEGILYGKKDPVALIRIGK